MKNEIRVKVKLNRIPLFHASISALRDLDRYDHVVFTSKNARKFFGQTLKESQITFPYRNRIIQVGQRSDLLKFSFKNKRILFPRSTVAPYDIVRRLRRKGAVVRVIPLYTASGVPLSDAQKNFLLKKKVSQLYFKSPSGVKGLLRQLRSKNRKMLLAIPARCIGRTTALTAKKAGFKQVFIR